MKRVGFSRLVPIILIVVIAIVAIAALIGLGRAIFGGGSSPAQPTDTSETALLSTDSDRSVSMEVRGPLIADEDFRIYSVTVSPSQRVATVYQGYQRNIADTKTFDNNSAAYEQFVYALDKANLVKGEPLTGDKNDTRGICATGNLYTFTVFQNDNVAKQLWTSTCSGSRGSLQASVSQLSNLFMNQIPRGSDILDKFNIAGQNTLY